jgi:hypothetical protein
MSFLHKCALPQSATEAQPGRPRCTGNRFRGGYLPFAEPVVSASRIACRRCASVAGVLLEGGYAFRGGRIASERTAAHLIAFQVDGTTREALSIGSSEHFALPRLRPPAAQADRVPPQPALTDVGVYLGWFGRATRLVHYGSALAALLDGLPGVRRALDAEARRIQRSRAQPATAQSIWSDVVAAAGDATGRELATVHLTGGDPYSFTAPILAWAAGKAAADGVHPAGALGPVEAFGAADLENACGRAGSTASRQMPGEGTDRILPHAQLRMNGT